MESCMTGPGIETAEEETVISPFLVKAECSDPDIVCICVVHEWTTVDPEKGKI